MSGSARVGDRDQLGKQTRKLDLGLGSLSTRFELVLPNADAGGNHRSNNA